VVFEGSAARTSIVWNSLNPRWGAHDKDSFRAFKFGVRKPYSVLYIAINDYDGGRSSEKFNVSERGASEGGEALESEGSTRLGINADDPIGRVAIQLGRLVSGCEYDCWYELGLGAIERPDGKLGRLRVRVSVTFKSERVRVLAYVDSPPPTFIVPFHKKKYRASANFAKRGLLANESYDWDVLQVYLEELKTTVKLLILFIAVAESILLWRCSVAHFSLANCLLFQALISYPQFFPASWSLGLIVLLLSTYSVPSDDKRLDAPLHQRASLVDLIVALALNKKPPPLECRPCSPNAAQRAREPATSAEQLRLHDFVVGNTLRATVGGAASAVERMSTGGERGRAGRKRASSPEPTAGDERGAEPMPAPTTVAAARESILRDFERAVVAYWEEQILGVFRTDVPAEATLKFQKERIDAEVAQFIDEGNDSLEERVAKRRDKEKQKEKASFFSSVGNALNPVAKVLGPVQTSLARFVPRVRQVRYVLLWNDRIVTFWLVVALSLATVALAMIPWGLVLYYGARVGGVVLFGPHMHFIGRWVDKRRAEEQEDARKFLAADEPSKQRMLAAYREELMKEARAQVGEALEDVGPRSERSERRHAYLERSDTYAFLNKHTRSNANIKYVAAAELERSMVQPLPAAAALGREAEQHAGYTVLSDAAAAPGGLAKDSPKDLL